MEHSIKLTFGYEGKDGVTHDDVTFGRRLTTGDMILLDSDPRSQNATQNTDMIRAKSITKFGTLKMPVSLDVLLSLNSIDREDIAQGFDRFCQLSREDRPSEYRENNIVEIRFGFDIDGTAYTVVDLGRMITGRDEVDADTLGLSGIARECFLLGRRITNATTADGNAPIGGPFELDRFKDLDAEDLNLLRMGAHMADLFFRLKGKGAPEVGTGESSDPAVAGDGNEGSGDPGSPDGTDTDVSTGDKGAE